MMGKKRWYIRPGYLAVIGAVVATAMVITAFLERRNTDGTIMGLIAERGEAVAGQIEQGAALAIRASKEVEKQIGSRLLTVARETARISAIAEVDRDQLVRLATESDILAVELVSPEGRVEISSSNAEPPPPDYASLFAPLLVGNEQESVPGLLFDDERETARFVAGVRRGDGGIVVCSVDAGTLLNLRSAFGLGRLIQDAGAVHGISYIMIQDEAGILAATPNVSGARRILDDSFLSGLWDHGGSSTRTLSFQGKDVLEVVKVLSAEGERIGLLRAAFDLKEMKRLQSRTLRRLLIMVAVLAILAIISIDAVVLYQNMNLAARAHDEVTTFSGSVLAGMADGVLVISEGGGIELANDASHKMFGGDIEAVPPGLVDGLEEVWRTGGPMVWETEAGEPSPRTLAVSAKQVTVPGEAASHIVLIARDVTEERHLSEQLRRTERTTALGKLAAAVAHEVRNPLNAIGMTAQRLGKEFEVREGREEYLGFLSVISDEVRRLDDIITQFLQFAREPEMRLERHDVGSLVESVITQVSAQAASGGVRLAFEVPAGLSAILDAKQIRQVLLNLVLNAVEAIDGPGTVRITARLQGPWLEMTVEDNGRGMGPDELKQAFDLHFTTKDRGTGLGLPIAQRIIERHGGSLRVESEHGSGTVVRIRIAAEERS